MKKIVIDTDLLTSILGVITSFIILIHQLGLIDNNLFSLLSGCLSLVFGYFTNKIRIRKEIDKKTMTITKTTELDS
jgi:hypothetical protein